MGKIKLEGIEVMVRIGLLEEEQFAPQDLYVSLELSYDFSNIRESDEITDGIDYREIVGFVREFSKAYDGKTLERYAHLLAAELKGKFDFSKVRLTVDKPRYVQKLGLREISVEVER
jgi:FolB domain-containing protein